MRTSTRLLAIISVLAGIAIALYGAVAILGLSDIIIGKHSAAARDTTETLLTPLIGLALAAWGAGALAIGRHSTDKHNDA